MMFSFAMSRLKPLRSWERGNDTSGKGECQRLKEKGAAQLIKVVDGLGYAPDLFGGEGIVRTLMRRRAWA
jgi:hypothetical protein